MQKLVLFDFDGTLADTAPDLAAAANKQRERKGLPPLPHETFRPYASHGARGLLKVALDIAPGDRDYETCRQQFLEDYEQGMTTLTTLFSGVNELLGALKDEGYAWGIVTNKMEYLAIPLVVHLGLFTECAVTVGGDTTSHTKPHPAPLLHAAKETGFAPADCIYVGDDERDIIAGKAAGMATIVAAYGYCGKETALHTWQADAIAESPLDIWPAIQRWAVR
ncbi:phosphoglycolate phosphatase [Pollutimonas nitritireducens]|uniref:phosphoglycolate phosphatase n=1 Tax=Pollutimonas nitritireducens TaxID=2045209 RepID=A0A2N4UIW8_9BURK|nr:phosphoglycolate phosphatase [Pollutimonas nitritireducens]PLC54961.1 phosphoglycolate phosphatase [Pollutimonas nitritireducens]